jgi:hypothetical protein
MRRAAAGATVIVVALIVAFVAVRRASRDQPAAAAEALRPAATAEARPDFIYGRITTGDGTTYEGRLRWHGDEEAFWSDYFDGARDENPWAVHAPGGPPDEGIELFGFRLGDRDRDKLDRPFMVRFGDIARIVAHVSEVEVTLKSGTRVVLDRFEAGDIDDGVRVWDPQRGVVDLDARQIRTIDFLDAPPLAAPGRLHGTVRTRNGEFTGFIQWQRRDSVLSDELDGRVDGREHRLRYDTIRSISRRSARSILVTLLDGREMELSGTQEAGRNNRGVSVDDDRYGRVVIPWETFERVEFSPAGNGAGYGDFAPGRPLSGSVTTRAGRRLAGRLVYDFDESETVETFDAASADAEYTIPFGLVASIELPDGARGNQRASVILRNGEELQLDRAGDLGAGNAGILVFIEERQDPEYVPWSDVARIDLSVDTEPTKGAKSVP